MARSFSVLLLLLLPLPLVQGQMVSNPARKGEFPGLNLLPAGSIVRNISLPRYEKHRVSSHILADVLEIISPRRVKLVGIRSSLFNEAGEATEIQLEWADYDFETEMMSTDRPVTLRNPRFRANGSSATFSNVRQQGLLRGPVHTIFHTAELPQAVKSNTAAP